ncbi:polyphosphate kinase 2 family protein [bacterium]|nr:polyphosphate kinase 2 family protein [bacterium]
MIEGKIVNHFLIRPGKRFRLRDHKTNWVPKTLAALGDEFLKETARNILEKNIRELAEAQDLLYASDTYSVLVIFQAMDAAGKDGTIKHVMSGVNPQGCQVYSFKTPTTEELDHNFLWRCMKALPERGRIGIFNRSYYEDVLVVRVHKDLVANQRVPNAKPNKTLWKERYEDINSFERHLVRNGTVIIKFFLNVSKKEQKKRFLERLDTADKNWKFSIHDVEERQHWDDYMEAYEDAIKATSTPWAPWYVIPADRKYIARAAVADILSRTIQSLELSYPKVTAEQKLALKKAKKQLDSEK